MATPETGQPPRIYALRSTAEELGTPPAMLVGQARELGFDAILLTADAFSAREGSLKSMIRACRDGGVRLLLDVVLDHFPIDHPLVERHPDAFAIRRQAAGEGPIDPRQPTAPAGEALARLRSPAGAEVVGSWAEERMRAWAAEGVSGFRTLRPDAAAPGFWKELIARVTAGAPDLLMIAYTPGVAREAALALAGCGFDYLVSSLAWWDVRARWFVEEHEALRAVAPLIAEALPTTGAHGPHATDPEVRRRAQERALKLAAIIGTGLIVPSDGGADDAVRSATALATEFAFAAGEMRVLTGSSAEVTALSLTDTPDGRTADRAVIVLANPDLEYPAKPRPEELMSSLGAGFEPVKRRDADRLYEPLAPGEVRLLRVRRAKPILKRGAAGRQAAKAATRCPRLVVENISPSVSDGAFPAKRTVGDWVTVEADIYSDGHGLLEAELQWRALDEETWRSVPMQPLGNDRWRAGFPLERLGRYEFAVEAWVDVFGGFRRDFDKKLAAGVAQEVDILEGRRFVEAARDHSDGDLKAALTDALRRFDKAAPDERPAILLSEELAKLMDRADDRPFRLRSDPPQLIDAERLAARFASWYELFPRSQTDDPSRHGTFDDVIGRLPAIRAMGFDVLYFPPIHPIGETHRKGRNNSLTAEPGDPGSPYAIGSRDGGHDAIDPQLGTLADFCRLVRAAADHGLEIALDFAIQCSPDHPWLKEHPGWFDWRPDGTIKYAENPPKKYEDIVNVDFYTEAAVPDLWLALRDVVLFWVREGVRTFRVDNPHTKPFPFWEWMIREVRSAHPDVIFLSEAFTRPKVMYRLAKIGFSQSYTYFTWRDEKAELTEYLTELTTTAPKEFFRPHFFVNTPDINPRFLQTSGRAGFRIRAVLAATLSGLWGVYSGFELLESEPVPGKEEYLHSEKYEIKPRDWQKPGNIIPDIALLNRLRKGHPALQSHLGVTFYNAFNDRILYYGKATPAKDDMILVAVSLDPHHAQEADFEIPLWEWGLPDHGTLEVEDLVRETRFAWHGKHQHMRLDPDQPYAIWRVRPQGRR